MFKVNRNQPLWNLDRQGGLTFGLRERLTKQRFRVSSVFEHPAAAVAVMAVCALLDYVMFKQLFCSFLYDHEDIRRLSTIGCIIGFDLAPIYLGILVRKKHQGKRVSNLMIAILIAAFIFALVVSVWLRIVLRDLVLPADSSDSNSIYGIIALEQQSNPGALPYAVFSSVLPIVTSLVSFGVSYIVSNPLKKELETLSLEQIQLEEKIGQIKALLAEYKADAEFQARLLSDDQVQYDTALGMIRERAVEYSDYVRERIKEHLGDPAATNALSRERCSAIASPFESSLRDLHREDGRENTNGKGVTMKSS